MDPAPPPAPPSARPAPKRPRKPRLDSSSSTAEAPPPLRPTVDRAMQRVLLAMERLRYTSITGR